MFLYLFYLHRQHLNLLSLVRSYETIKRSKSAEQRRQDELRNLPTRWEQDLDFSFRKKRSCLFFFFFELLQDGAPQTLQCPLCPEGVSLSAAKSDRQSGALKAHTPFSPQRLRSQTPGRGSDTHTNTHARWSSVFRAAGTGHPPEATASIGLTCALWQNIVRKSLARKKERDKVQLSTKQSFPVQATPTRLNKPLFQGLICGSVSVLIRYEKGDSEAVKSCRPPAEKRRCRPV